MSKQASPDSHFDNAGIGQFRHCLAFEPPTIKILLYTDDPDDITPTDSRKDFGLVSMLEHLTAREPASAHLCIKWVSRNSTNQAHADQKLDDVLEKERLTGHPFEEIWFFGMHQANKKNISFGVFRGGPQSELTENEIGVLESWMTAGGNDKEVGGGVLMTGDHNHPRPTDAMPSTNPRCPGTAENPFLGRGRALGRCVPRAGQLRVWEGDPTNSAANSQNTIQNSGLQTDRVPQQLTLVNVDGNGDPDLNGQPHAIFHYKRGQYIEFFPDHAHEGRVVDTGLDQNSWPGQVRPHVVARSFDQFHGRMVDLVVTYQGDLANVGRIVADSSWHHYFNLNVRPFRHPSPEGSPGDQIGQFYANLAVWLAPRARRFNMALAMLWRLANYTALMEPLGDIRIIGREASSILSGVASPCEIKELIQSLIPIQYGLLHFIHEGAFPNHLPSQELLLGSILNSYHEEMILAETSDNSYQPKQVEEVIERGFKRALTEHASLIEHLASETRKLINPTQS